MSSLWNGYKMWHEHNGDNVTVKPHEAQLIIIQPKEAPDHVLSIQIQRNFTEGKSLLFVLILFSKWHEISFFIAPDREFDQCSFLIHNPCFYSFSLLLDLQSCSIMLLMYLGPEKWWLATFKHLTWFKLVVQNQRQNLPGGQGEYFVDFCITFST